jgi:hypothetical protein
MIIKSYFITMLLLLSLLHPVGAQDLTGRWEGRSGSERFQVNIVQEKQGEICGYTYDQVINDRRSYCKAYFKGRYDKAQDRWVLNGISFIENSGSHVLMRITLWKDSEDGELVLSGLVAAKSAFGFILSLGSSESITLRRMSRTPAKLPDNMPTCFPEPEKKPISPERPEKPKDPPPVIKRDPERPVRIDTVKPKQPVIIKHADTPFVKISPKKDSAFLPQKVKERKSNTFSRIPVHVKNITLDLYDNGVVDGDTVSVYYNGKLLVNRQRLTEKAISINLELDLMAPQHEITLFAHNLGGIPPNTALIVVTAADKRYELHAKADLQENAVLVFEYSPK